MNDASVEQLLQFEKDFQDAIVENNADAIGHFVADDWIIVGSDGKIIEKDRFLEVIKSGALTHHAMRFDEPRIRIYGDTTVITGRVTSAGTFMGTEFTTLERSTDVFVKIDGQWRCVLTQLSPISPNKID